MNLATGVSTSTQTGTDSLAGIENVIGSSGNDFITGDVNDNVITGGLGNDTVNGSAGNNTFVATVGDGNDSYNGGSGTDTYDLSATTANASVILTTTTAHVISTEAGSDTLTSIENVIGGAGNDSLFGGDTGREERLAPVVLVVASVLCQTQDHSRDGSRMPVVEIWAGNSKQPRSDWHSLFISGLSSTHPVAPAGVGASFTRHRPRPTCAAATCALGPLRSPSRCHC